MARSPLLLPPLPLPLPLPPPPPPPLLGLQASLSTRVFISANGNPTAPVLKYATEPTLDLFLLAAGEALGIPGRRCFARSGGEIEDVSLLMHNETLFVSSGEDFLPCRASDAEHLAGLCQQLLRREL
eukprot:COSAG05_NODE_8250_length_723_cov_0.615385_1_plen_127_part_00